MATCRTRTHLLQSPPLVIVKKHGYIHTRHVHNLRSFAETLPEQLTEVRLGRLHLLDTGLCPFNTSIPEKSFGKDFQQL